MWSTGTGRTGERSCRTCGERLKSGVRADTAFCSSERCARQWRTERRLRKRLAAVRSGAGEAKCPVCGACWALGVTCDRLPCTRRGAG